MIFKVNKQNFSGNFFYTVPILRDEEVPAYISVAHKEEQEI